MRPAAQTSSDSTARRRRRTSAADPLKKVTLRLHERVTTAIRDLDGNRFRGIADDPDKRPDQKDVARSRLMGTDENAEWQELVMVMNAFDTNFDDENEFYAANTVAFAYMKAPIRIEKIGRCVST